MAGILQHKDDIGYIFQVGFGDSPFAALNLDLMSLLVARSNLLKRRKILVFPVVVLKENQPGARSRLNPCCVWSWEDFRNPGRTNA
jgi:hypothetical protein